MLSVVTEMDSCRLRKSRRSISGWSLRIACQMNTRINATPIIAGTSTAAEAMVPSLGIVETP